MKALRLGSWRRAQILPIPIRRAFLALVIVIATTGAVISIPLTTSSAGASTGGDWQVSTSYPPSADPTNVTCPSTLDCYAVGGGQIMATTDGGNIWTNQTVPTSVTSLAGISCSSTSDCIAVGSSNPGLILVTTDAGATWSVADTVTSAYSMNGATCLPSSVCFAVGGDNSDGGIVLKSTDGGTTWSAQVLPSGADALFAIACISDTDCTAVGRGLDGGVIGAGVVGTTDGGSAWSTESVPPGVSYLSGVSCPSLTECVAVGGDDDIIATTDSGSSWTLRYPALPSSAGPLNSISCPSASNCIAVGGSGSQGVIFSTSDGGSTWTNALAPPYVPSLNGIFCLSTLDCTTVGGGVILGTSDGGTTWTQQPVPAGANRFNDVACPSPSECFAVGGFDDTFDTGGGGTILATTDGGTSWQNETLPSGIGTLFGIACPSVTVCFAVGYNEGLTNFILATTDGGVTWTSENVPAGVMKVNGIACPTTLACTAVGTSNSTGVIILSTTDGGNTWSSTSEIGATLASVACPSVTECFVSGDSGPGGVIFSTTDGGSTWTSQDIPGSNLFRSIACPSILDCTAVGSSGIVATSNGGQSWHSEPDTTRVDALSGVACPSTSVCESVGYLGTTGVIIATTDGGVTWTDASVPPLAGPLSGISCPSSMACVAVGQGSSQPDAGGLILTGSDLNPVTMNPATLPLGAIGQPYAATLAASGGTTPYSWSITSGALPPGLSFDGSTGSISGTPTAPGLSTFTVMVADTSTPATTATANLQIEVSPPSITPTVLPFGYSGWPYSASFSATGGTTPYSWSITNGSLPNGLVLNPATGVITGRPTGAGGQNFTVTLTDSSTQPMTSSLSLGITTYPGTVKIKTQSLHGGTVGEHYSTVLRAVGGSLPYTWQMGHGSNLPPGLVLKATTGKITGTPSKSGTFGFTVKVTDVARSIRKKAFSITIS